MLVFLYFRFSKITSLNIAMNLRKVIQLRKKADFTKRILVLTTNS